MRRPHRAAYRAPSRGHYDDNLHHASELSVPLLVEVPHHDSTTDDNVSPPSSVGSLEDDEEFFPLPELPPARTVRQRPLKRRICKAMKKLYNLLLDFMLLVFVCIMGLFFDVEVQVVRQDRRRARGSGRVVIQTGNGGNHRNYHDHADYNHAYSRSSNLLRTPPASLQGGREEKYWYQDPITREEIV